MTRAQANRTVRIMRFIFDEITAAAILNQIILIFHSGSKSRSSNAINLTFLGSPKSEAICSHFHAAVKSPSKP